MKAQIYDNLYRPLKIISGTFKDGRFEYKANDIMGFFGTTEIIVCDYSLTADIGKDKYAFYRFDGNDYIQLKFSEIKDHVDASLSNYSKDKKISELSRNNLYKRPLQLIEIIIIILMVMAVISFVLVYYSYQNLYNMWKNEQAPLNASINQNTQLIHIELNQTAKLEYLFNESIKAYQTKP